MTLAYNSNFVAEILEDEALVVARSCCNGVDPRAVETVLRENLLSGVRIASRAPSASCVRPRLGIGSAISISF